MSPTAGLMSYVNSKLCGTWGLDVSTNDASLLSANRDRYKCKLE